MLKKRPGILALALALLLAVQGAAFAQGIPQAADSQAAAKAVPTTAYTRSLKLGCRGTDVKALQQKLKTLGFYSGAFDGVYGKGTESAVKAFQKAHSMKADGIVGRTTHDAIFGKTSPPATTDGSDTTAPYTLGKMDNEITLKKGSHSDNVKDLQTVLKMKKFYSGAITGTFENATKNAVMSFQHSVGLKSDGVAGNYTLSALYTMLNPPDLAAILPWPAGVDAGKGLTIEKPIWSDVSSKIFTRGMVAEVVDVRSGYIFQVKRTGGTNHADVETLTPLDTATFYKSAGNFSWARRPIWVIVNGRRLAASMNCMPHGYDTIAGNDFKGQFCIHFVGSRTHGTNRIDPEHQACIEEAYEAGLAMTDTPTPSVSPSPSPDPSSTPAETPSASPTPTPTAGNDQQPPPG